MKRAYIWHLFLGMVLSAEALDAEWSGDTSNCNYTVLFQTGQSASSSSACFLGYNNVSAAADGQRNPLTTASASNYYDFVIRAEVRPEPFITMFAILAAVYMLGYFAWVVWSLRLRHVRIPFHYFLTGLFDLQVCAQLSKLATFLILSSGHNGQIPNGAMGIVSLLSWLIWLHHAMYVGLVLVVARGWGTIRPTLTFGESITFAIFSTIVLLVLSSNGSLMGPTHHGGPQENAGSITLAGILEMLIVSGIWMWLLRVNHVGMQIIRRAILVCRSLLNQANLVSYNLRMEPETERAIEPVEMQPRNETELSPTPTVSDDQAPLLQSSANNSTQSVSDPLEMTQPGRNNEPRTPRSRARRVRSDRPVDPFKSKLRLVKNVGNLIQYHLLFLIMMQFMRHEFNVVVQVVFMELGELVFYFGLGWLLRKRKPKLVILRRRRVEDQIPAQPADSTQGSQENIQTGDEESQQHNQETEEQTAERERIEELREKAKSYRVVRMPRQEGPTFKLLIPIKPVSIEKL